MLKKAGMSRDTLLRALDALCSVAVLPLAAYSDFQSDLHYLLINVALFLALTLAKGFQVLRRKQNSQPYIWPAMKGCAYLVCIPLLLLIPDRNTARNVISILLTAVLVLEAARLMWTRRTFTGILSGISLILVLFLVIKGHYERVLLYVMIEVFIHIVTLSFSEMNLKVLIKIIRKTKAANILAGLLLLMVAASFMIPPMEKSIPTFLDALWYCFAIVTTIGFGDFATVSPGGRVITVILGLYGLVVVALITSIIVNFYQEVKNDPEEEDGSQE